MKVSHPTDPVFKTNNPQYFTLQRHLELHKLETIHSGRGGRVCESTTQLPEDLDIKVLDWTCLPVRSSVVLNTRPGVYYIGIILACSCLYKLPRTVLFLHSYATEREMLLFFIACWYSPSTVLYIPCYNENWNERIYC